MTLLKLTDIYKIYSQGGLDVPALNNINLSIEEGEYVAIMGPSGSGKSTLMNIIGCLDKPTKGSYILGDEDISLLNDRKLSDIRNREIGFVFQQFNLMPRQSALQNVELPLQYAHVPRRERRPRCEEALIKVGLEERMHFKATQLSGGQKQRVAIARAIVNRPRILLADEPTGALDSKSGIQVMKLFKQLHEEGSTIIMITHAQEIAEHANRIIKIFDGEITSDEPNTPVAITVPDIPKENSEQTSDSEQTAVEEQTMDTVQADATVHGITSRFNDIKADTSDEDEDSDIYEEDMDEEELVGVNSNDDNPVGETLNEETLNEDTVNDEVSIGVNIEEDELVGDSGFSDEIDEIVDRIVQKVQSESIEQEDNKEDYKVDDDFDLETVATDITGGDSL